MLKLKLNLRGLQEAQAHLQRIRSGWSTWYRPSRSASLVILRKAQLQAFQSGGHPGAKWAPKAPLSVKLRGPGAPLAGLADLLRDAQLGNSAELRLALLGGEFLTEGGTTAAGSLAPGQKVPARQIMTISNDSRAEVLKRFARDFRTAIR